MPKTQNMKGKKAPTVRWRLKQLQRKRMNEAMAQVERKTSTENIEKPTSSTHGGRVATVIRKPQTKLCLERKITLTPVTHNLTLLMLRR